MTANSKLMTIPARRGKAIELKRGQRIKVINTHGSQVIDTWAFCQDDTSEFMSMEHTRATLSKLSPARGDFLYTNHRRPILAFVDDTSPGRHDTLMAACDSYRYKLLGCAGYHDNCSDNLAEALKQIGHRQSLTPSPLNLFMNIPWSEDGHLSFDPPVTKPGDYVVLGAERDVIVVFSACPQDMIPINGVDCTPTKAHCEILD